MRPDGRTRIPPPYELARLNFCRRFDWKPWEYDACPEDDLYLWVELTTRLEARQDELTRAAEDTPPPDVQRITFPQVP